MRVIRTPSPSHYRISASREELRIEFDDQFFNDAVIDEKGTTRLDYNIASIVQEVRTALYYVGTDGTKH